MTVISVSLVESLQHDFHQNPQRVSDLCSLSPEVAFFVKVVLCVHYLSTESLKEAFRLHIEGDHCL